jgi:hypothetical protein
MSNLEQYTGKDKASNSKLIDKKLAAVFRFVRGACERCPDEAAEIITHTNEALDDFQDLLDRLNTERVPRG